MGVSIAAAVIPGRAPPRTTEVTVQVPQDAAFDVQHGRRRVVIQAVEPEIDCGRFAIKRVVGETVEVTAQVFSDGHDRVMAVVLYRPADDAQWRVAPMAAGLNDVWTGRFRVESEGVWLYTVRGWIDELGTWQKDLVKKHDAGQDVHVDLQIGIRLLEEARGRASEEDAATLARAIEQVRAEPDAAGAVRRATDPQLHALANRYPDPDRARIYGRELGARVDRARANFSAWYEFFPRSAAAEAGRHGTFADAERMLPYVAKMGFDVVYLPPIHPIGRTKRKGKNNAPEAAPGDVGSPWAIGDATGGHTAVHPQLGTLEDLRHFVQAAEALGMEVALDIALQCSPDHPYVREHPDWFQWRPDGTIQYAENPPKKYEDILPIHFETAGWQPLWDELRDMVLFWVGQGVRIFRVDNPHTKPFAFWEYLIDQVKQRHPGVLFLAEAFTRPAVMNMLAKAGFTQSYTYFTWRNTKWELEQYLEQLTQTQVAEYLRPNFWPNTPDILPQVLQFGGRAAFVARLVLAATLSSNYGIYGPAFELQAAEALPGREEYLNSEKYELRHWNLSAERSLAPLIAWVNRIRREHAALQQTRNLEFLELPNELLLAYAKASDDGADLIVVVVTLDLHHRQAGHVRLPLDRWGIPANESFLAHDLLSQDRYVWQGEWNYVELDPRVSPAHVLQIHRRMRRETDFDYFM